RRYHATTSWLVNGATTIRSGIPGHKIVGAGVAVDVAVMDIRLPPGADGGLRTAQRVRAKYPDVGCC
ncbi:hypothetical protein, partial [Micromonospora olivasterospora]|uniref:hypothetical protein n=1 Tax=Micromonospora olivasterospora TaxID=1880 RepID=UPI003CD08AAD